MAVLYPTLASWGENRGELSTGMLLRPLLTTAVLAVLLAVAFLPLCRRSAVRVSLWVTSALLVLFSFDLLLEYVIPPLLFLLAAFGYSSSIAIHYPLGIGITLLLLGGVGGWSQHPRITGERALPALLLLTGVQLAGACLPLFGPAPTQLLSSSEPSPAVTASPYSGKTTTKESVFPDLYCIVLDAYGRQDQLATLFGVDNEPFLRQLEQRGFFVARHARANYLQTPLALSAAFNLAYLPSAQTGNIDEANTLLNKSRLFQLMKHKGFQIVAVPTNIAQTKLTVADLTFEEFDGVKATLTPLDRLVLAKTPLGRLLENENAAFAEHRNRLLGALEKNLPTAAAVPTPKLVFAHILAPHPPFVFGPKGEVRIPRRTTFTIGDGTDYSRNNEKSAYRQSYADQLTYLNGKVLEALDAIKVRQKRPAILIVMGDHGSRMETDWKSLERTNLHEPFANLMAVATPDGQAGALLGDAVSPINVFRLLLTRYYGQSYPRLPDRSYYSTLTKPYAFTDVTDRS